MKRFLKNTLYSFLSTLRTVADAFFHFQEVSVLCYHSINTDDWELTTRPEIFDQQLGHLKKRGYHFATLDEIVAYASGKGTLPRKTVAITFDDGYEDLLTHALSILKKYEAPATVFVIARPEAARTYLKPEARMLDSAQLSELDASDLVSVGHHSVTHAMLESIDDASLARELANEHGYRYLAYPGGHYSAKVAAAVKVAGFSAAFTIKPGLIRVGDDLFALKRNVITGTMPFWQFALRTTKAIAWYRTITRAKF